MTPQPIQTIETEPTRPQFRRPGLQVILYVLRALGAFKLAQFLTRSRLRILGYHGIAVGDQHEYSPFLFMRESTFHRRLEILRRRGVTVISLDDAVKGLQIASNRTVQAVITIDDGWWSTLEYAAPLLQRFGYPATLYLSTRHAVEQTPVAPVVLSYMFWKRNETRLALAGVAPSVDGTYDLGGVHGATHLLLEGKIAQLDSAAQARMLQQVAAKLGLEAAALTGDKRFHLIAMDDVHRLQQMGVDTQLHTHSHFMPDDFEQFRQQLQQNQDYIRMHSQGDTPRHFCYPSGRYTDKHAKWLEQLDIKSATTCDPGMNTSGQNPYVLRRFLDSESISEIEFAGHVSGLFELAKLLRDAVGRYLGR